MNTFRYGAPRKCSGRMANILGTHPLSGMATLPLLLAPIFLSSEVGSSQKPSMKSSFSASSTKDQPKKLAKFEIKLYNR